MVRKKYSEYSKSEVQEFIKGIAIVMEEFAKIWPIQTRVEIISRNLKVCYDILDSMEEQIGDGVYNTAEKSD